MAGPATMPERERSHSSQNVIDLTSDDPPIELTAPAANSTHRSAATRDNNMPRLGQEVIDVDALPDVPDRRLPSPELEVTYTRPARVFHIGGPHRPHPNRHALAQPMEPQQYYPNFGGSQPALFIQGRHGAHRTGRHPHRPLDMLDPQYFVRPGETQPRLGPDFFANHAHQHRQARERIIQEAHQRGRLMAAENNLLPVRFDDFENNGLQVMGIELDYDRTALGLNENPTPPPRPTYDPPPDARAGFTRSPGEDDEIVCPNCDGELGVGDSEEKRSVWFVKGCGHVYCGECAQNRQKSKRGAKMPRNSKVTPFKTCAVCDKSVTARTAMKQIFL
ncbi:MAG: hypothetical protein M4579_006880 [Chaenotheca gracillima]|nr:MAG: hypothetical protein M4579_006880 [Chaenotheca gracillima]